MQQNIKGTIIKGVGGLYYVRPDGTDELIPCRARGKFRHAGLTPLVGDRVLLAMDNEAVIDEIIDRKNALIRPPLANLDILFVSMASAFPSPILLSVDKLICIAEHHGIEPVIVVGKSELDTESTQKICDLYRGAGFEVFAISAKNGDGVDALEDYLKTHLNGKIAAFLIERNDQRAQESDERSLGYTQMEDFEDD
jgi:ribosome biogenesis GTPase